MAAFRPTWLSPRTLALGFAALCLWGQDERPAGPKAVEASLSPRDRSKTAARVSRSIPSAASLRPMGSRRSLPALWDLPGAEGHVVFGAGEVEVLSVSAPSAPTKSSDPESSFPDRTPDSAESTAPLR